MADKNDEFISALYRENSSKLVRFLTRKLQEPQQAEEVAQEAYLRLQKLDAPAELDNARAFLFQVASNLATDQLRRRQLHNNYLASQQQQVEVQVDAGMNMGLDPVEQLAAQEKALLIKHTLDSMQPKVRQAFLLHRKSGLSYSAIAAEMQVSVSSVEKYIFTALKQFRATLVPKKEDSAE
jgi:RNA polymerase sigma-70 factor (ECF subfamily)